MISHGHYLKTLPELVKGKIKPARIGDSEISTHPTILIVPVDVPWCSPEKSHWNSAFPGKETAEALVGLGMVRASDAWPICLGWVLYGMLHLAPNIPIIRCSRTIIQVSHNKAGASYLA